MNVLQLITLLLLSLMLSGCASQEVKDKPALKIGAMLPLTGWGAYWGVPGSHGLEMAKQDIKREFGDDIAIIIEDHKADAKEAATAASKLVAIDNVDVVYSEFTGPSIASSPIVEQAGKLFMYDAFSHQPLKTNSHALKFFHDPYTECKKLAKIAKEQGKKHAVGVIAQLDFAKSCEDAIQEIYPDVVFHEFQMKDTDFRTILTKIKATDADVIISLGYEDNMVGLFAQKKELGLDIPIYCGDKADCLGKKVLALGPETLEGATTFDFEVEADFAKRYNAIWPEAPSTDIQPAATTYDMVLYVYKAYKMCDVPDRDCLLKKIKSSDYKSMIQSNGFGEDRILQLNTINEVYKDGKFTEVLP